MKTKNMDKYPKENNSTAGTEGEPVDEATRKILSRWKEEWGIKTEAAEEKMTWEDFVISNYELFSKKVEKNRVMNFSAKEKVIKEAIVAIGGLVGFGLLLLLITVVFSINMSITQFLSVLAVAGVLASAALYTHIKYVEIKKYQETWIRHSDALYKIQEEMMRYSEDLSPYDGENDVKLKKKLFKHRFLGILSDNNKKFVDNMERKEATLSDLPARLNFKKE